MTINDKINLLLRMQICHMQEDCSRCPLDSWDDDKPLCNVNTLIEEATKALMEGEDPAEVRARTEDVVADILIDVGVPANGQGYPALVEAVMYLIDNPDAVNAACKDLYAYAGEKVGTTAVKAERNMRHCIERAFARIDYDTVVRYFGNSLDPNKGTPTTSEFLARIADIARRRARRVCHE